MTKEKENINVEEVKPLVHWQWIKGDDSGNVVTFKNEGPKWITFIGDVIIPPQNTTTSPIRVLFNKQKKNNKVKLLLEFPVNIPPKGIYELMSTSFDKDEVNEQLYSFIIDQLSQAEITECLQDSIKSLIESKYKGE